jgi:hypothetical protein
LGGKRGRKRRIEAYPNGTLLCSHRCVQPRPVLGTTSEVGEACSLKETDRTPTSPFCFRVSDKRGAELSLCTALACLSPLTLPVNSENPTNGLNGVDGEEFKDTTVGGEVNEAGARTVKVRSSEVKFEAWRVRT